MIGFGIPAIDWTLWTIGLLVLIVQTGMVLWIWRHQ